MIRSTTNSATKDILDSRDFYEMCQSYRHSQEWYDHGLTPTLRFEALKEWIREHCFVGENPHIDDKWNAAPQVPEAVRLGGDVGNAEVDRRAGVESNTPLVTSGRRDAAQAGLQRAPTTLCTTPAAAAPAEYICTKCGLRVEPHRCREETDW